MGTNQRGCFDTALKILALSMVVGLILSLPLALAGRTFGRVFFRPAVLSAVVKNSVLDSGIIEVTIREDLFARSWFDTTLAETDNSARYFEHLSPADREEIFSTLLPPNWIENQFTQMLRGFYTWLDEDGSIPVLALDMVPLKTNLLRGGIISFVDSVVDSWPSCKPDQVEALQRKFFEGGEMPEVLCEPPEPLRARVIDLATLSFEEQVRQLPDKLEMIDETASGDDFTALKDQLLGFRALMLWGWMLPFSLLGLIMALVIRSWSDFGRWWGLPLLWGGVGTFLLALFLSGIRDNLIAEWSGGVEFSSAVQNVFETVLIALYTAGLRPLWLQALLVIGIGIVLWQVGRRAILKAQRPQGTGARHPAVDAAVIPSKDPEFESDDETEPPAGIFG